MTGEAAFLAALRADPADVTTRRVYADWLDEYDLHDEARVLRGELAVEQVRALLWTHELAAPLRTDGTDQTITFPEIEVPPLLRPVVRILLPRPAALIHLTARVWLGMPDVFVRAGGRTESLASFRLVDGQAHANHIGGRLVFTPECPVELWMHAVGRARVTLSVTLVGLPQ